MAYQHGIAKQDQKECPSLVWTISQGKVDESVKDLPVEVYFGLGSKEVSVKYELPAKLINKTQFEDETSTKG